MKISWRYFALFLFFAIMLMMVLLNQSLFYTYVIGPVTRILWFIVRTILMINQDVYWALLILTVFAFGLRMVPSRQENYGRPASYSRPPLLEDRVAYWEALLHSAADNANARLTLQHNLNDLHSSIDAFVENDGQKEVSLLPTKPGLWQKIVAKWRRSFLDRVLPIRRAHLDSEFEKNINQILDSMETTMEIQNDQSSSNPDER